MTWGSSEEEQPKHKERKIRYMSDLFTCDENLL